MKSVTVLGILLAVLGVLALVYQGFSYTRREKVLDVGPIHATRDDTERVPLPPIVGGVALLGAVALLAIGARRKA
jgi:drug/metabolite transporter (DMT)-like permease